MPGVRYPRHRRAEVADRTDTGGGRKSTGGRAHAVRAEAREGQSELARSRDPKTAPLATGGGSMLLGSRRGTNRIVDPGRQVASVASYVWVKIWN